MTRLGISGAVSDLKDSQNNPTSHQSLEVFDEPHARHDSAPSKNKKGQPYAGSDFLEDNIGWHLCMPPLLANQI